MRLLNSKSATIAAAAVIVVGLGAGSAEAAHKISGAMIKNGTIGITKLSAPLQAQINAPGPQGPQGPAGNAGGAGSYQGSSWSIIDRNSIGNFVGALRAGPSSEAFSASVKPPLGIGSLGLQTGSANDKVAFGDQVDYAGKQLSTINTVKYQVFTTGENATTAVGNLPGVTFEINPNKGGRTYSSLVYVPTSIAVAAANKWNAQDGSTAAQWYLTGGAGTDSSCNQNTYCSLAQVKAFFPDAIIQTVAVTKGRDYAFSGAVDALQINGTTYDFEPTGVKTTN